MDSDLKGVGAFFSTKKGKILIVIVVIIAAIYFGNRWWTKKQELKKYGGNTKSDIENKIKSDFANWYIYTKIKNDIEAAGRTDFREGLISWYDENAKVQLTQNSLSETLIGLNVPPEMWKDFNYLVGQKVILMPYWVG